jgi:hypothetical protein
MRETPPSRLRDSMLRTPLAEAARRRALERHNVALHLREMGWRRTRSSPITQDGRHHVSSPRRKFFKRKR